MICFRIPWRITYIVESNEQSESFFEYKFSSGFENSSLRRLIPKIESQLLNRKLSADSLKTRLKTCFHQNSCLKLTVSLKFPPHYIQYTVVWTEKLAQLGRSEDEDSRWNHIVNTSKIRLYFFTSNNHKPKIMLIPEHWLRNSLSFSYLPFGNEQGLRSQMKMLRRTTF